MLTRILYYILELMCILCTKCYLFFSVYFTCYLYYLLFCTARNVLLKYVLSPTQEVLCNLFEDYRSSCDRAALTEVKYIQFNPQAEVMWLDMIKIRLGNSTLGACHRDKPNKINIQHLRPWILSKTKLTPKCF
jgi:hypothetical protein